MKIRKLLLPSFLLFFVEVFSGYCPYDYGMPAQEVYSEPYAYQQNGSNNQQSYYGQQYYPNNQQNSYAGQQDYSNSQQNSYTGQQYYNNNQSYFNPYGHYTQEYYRSTSQYDPYARYYSQPGQYNEMQYYNQNYKRGYNNWLNRKRQLTYTDSYDKDVRRRAFRRGDWGYRQNYRYDREAFYNGATQAEAYDLEHQDGAGGIGIDPDYEYLQLRKYILDDKKARQSREMQMSIPNKQNVRRAYRERNS